MYLPRGNGALLINPPTGAEVHITTHASDWLWTVFALFAFTAVCIAIWSLFMGVGRRAFHNLALMMLAITGAAYFALASDLGFTIVRTEFGHFSAVGSLRQVFWVRFVGWTLTFPLLLITILYAADASGADLTAAAFAGAFTWAAWLVSSLVTSTYKWGFFTFGIATLIWADAVLLSGTFRAPAPYRSSPKVAAVWVVFLYLLYPIAFGLSEGGNVISPTSESVFYGILDLLVLPVLLVFLLAAVGEAGTEGLRWGYHHVNTGTFENRGGQHVTTGTGTGTGDVRDVEKAPRGKLFGRKGAHDVATTPAAPDTTLPRHSEATLEGDLAPPPPTAT